jgi:hypothetical protein
VSRHRARLAASASSAGFVIAAATVGMANVVAPFERGWWLTAYLFLVGGLAQLLLIRGQEALTASPPEPPTVAVADIAQVMEGVDAGSVALLLALALYQVGARRGRPRSHRRASPLRYGYAALVVGLGGSVLLGTFLAGAVPGQ